MKVLVLTRYDRLGASSRLRFLQYLPWLQRYNIDFEVQPFISDDMLLRKYKEGRYAFRHLLRSYTQRILHLFHRSHYDLVWIEKECLPWFPAKIERLLLDKVPYVLDFDDAWFHNYDLHRFGVIRRALGRRLDNLMAGARLVVGGNQYLLNRAQHAGAQWVERVPTVIDLDRYPIKRQSPSNDLVPKIVWIGSPSTVHYLSSLSDSLRTLSSRCHFKLRVIGAVTSIKGVDFECVPWTEASEVGSISECDIGIMPLYDSPWERGKCGYKLIQYMACGLPVVASPVGINSEIVEQGLNGFLANADAEWVAALEQLLVQPQLRSRMGGAGRGRVENEYCLQVTGPKIAKLLIQAAKGV